MKENCIINSPNGLFDIAHFNCCAQYIIALQYSVDVPLYSRYQFALTV